MLSDTQNLLMMHTASLIGVLALALRTQLRLRAVLLLSIALNIVDHLFVRQGANLNALIWDVVALATNLWVIVQLLLDRTHIGLSDEEERLFQAWGSLSPGEFRALLKLAQWRTADAPDILTSENVIPDRLYYVLEGEVELTKAARNLTVVAPTFIGEVAFVKERAASATVRVSAGTRYVVWSTAGLRRHFVKHQAMRVVVMRLLSADMALKVARA